MIVTILGYVVVSLAFMAFLALVYSGMTLGMGKISPHFELTLPEDWTFRELYLRYLIVAAVFTFVAIPLTPLMGCLGYLLGLVALTAAYRKVFDADWPQAIIIGGMGGAIALVLFVFLLVSILQPLGLIETERPNDPSQQIEQYEDVDPESLGYQGGWTAEEPWIEGRRSAVQLPSEQWASGARC